MLPIDATQSIVAYLLLNGVFRGNFISNHQIMYPNQLGCIENLLPERYDEYISHFQFFAVRVFISLVWGLDFHFVFAFTNMVLKYEPHECILV